MTITIEDVTGPELVTTNLAASTAREAVEELAGLLERAGRVTDRTSFVEVVMAREDETGGTGMESGLAIPHGKSAAVQRASFAFGRSAAGVDFGAADGTPADLIFLIAAPEGEDDLHVTLLSRLARKLIHQQFRTSLREADTAEAVFTIIEQEVEL
jgi:fructose-specific phosphotransferase system IIA component